MSEPHLNADVMRGFLGELRKVANPAALLGHLTRKGTRHAVQAGLGSGLGLGVGAGALAGAAHSGVKGYREARDAGAGAGGAALMGLGTGLGGAVRGAGIGALAGAGAGALAGAVRPVATIQRTRQLSRLDNSVGGLSQFGQRQVHGFTGFAPGGSSRAVERIGGGAYQARKGLQAAEAGGSVAEVARAREALAASERAQQMGLTNLPGLAKAVKDRGVVEALGTGMREQWASSPGWGKALMAGFPALAGASALATPEVAGEAGKGERFGRALGSVGYMAAPLSLGAGTLLGAGLEQIGGGLGRGVDALRGHRRKQVSADRAGDR